MDTKMPWYHYLMLPIAFLIGMKQVVVYLATEGKRI